VTTPTIEAIEVGGKRLYASELVTLTQPLSRDAIAHTVQKMLASVDRAYALDLVVMLQLSARIAEDTGERITLDDFAREEGWEDELNELRSQ